MTEVSNSVKRWAAIGATVVIGVPAIIWTLLWWLGLAVPVFGFLDAHTWVITAATGWVTALATVVIAAFTWGTLGLFRLEEERFEAEAVYLRDEANRIGHTFLQAADTIAAIAELPEDTRTEYSLLLEEELGAVRGRLKSAAQALHELRDEARGSSKRITELAASASVVIPSVVNRLDARPDGSASEIESEAETVWSLGQLIRTPFVAESDVEPKTNFPDSREGEIQEEVVRLVSAIQSEAREQD